jgi:ubiquinone/menaquinone biosynthesis C-methylase UbiE
MSPVNIDEKTVKGFGQEWSRFDQSAVPEDELKATFESYFNIFPWDSLPADAVGFDLGCGSGRWARLVARRVGTVHCIDPSEAALDVARRNLRHQRNCRFHLASVDAIPLGDDSMDFGYALGVLHHVPDTAAGLRACVRKLKVGAPFLVYLYYAFDNRPRWFRLVWRTSEAFRLGICRLPFPLRYAVTQLIAAGVYYPLARLSYALERVGWNVENVPLSVYRRVSFYSMRTDALDRFGTRLERRFTAGQIRAVMEKAGLEHVTFSQAAPYWCAVGRRSALSAPSDQMSLG